MAVCCTAVVGDKPLVDLVDVALLVTFMHAACKILHVF